MGELSDGSLTTLQFAERFDKPYLVIQLEEGSDDVRRTREWLGVNRITTLNVAGPRESKRPGIYQATLAFLDSLA
jgi:hypothetical protein